MNTNTTIRVAKYAGVCVGGLATSFVLAAPALAMQPPVPDPLPGSGQHHKIFDSLDGRDGPAAPTQTTTRTPTPSSVSDGVDWSTLAAGFGGGAALAGAVVLGAAQIRRRSARPA